MKRLILAVFAVALVAASCNIFGNGPVSAGIAKSVNGGADWQFSNTVASSTTATLTQSNIAKLAFDPQNHETVFAGSYTDGLYKSTDSGTTWSRILSKIDVYDFVINPTDSKTIYVSGIYGDQGKVLKSTDGGASWQEIYNEASADVVVRAMDLNPVAPGELVIGTASGDLIKSADGGLSWQLAVSFNDQINQVVWRQNGIYVVLNSKGVQKGSTSADNFQDATVPLTKNSGLFNVYGTIALTFNQVYVDPVASSLLYLTTSHGLYKSVDSGTTWTNIALPTQQNVSNTRPIAVAQTSSNIVFTSVGPVIYKSLNGGQTWQTQNINTGGYVNYILIDPILPQIDYAGLYQAQ